MNSAAFRPLASFNTRSLVPVRLAIAESTSPGRTTYSRSPGVLVAPRVPVAPAVLGAPAVPGAPAELGALVAPGALGAPETLGGSAAGGAANPATATSAGAAP